MTDETYKGGRLVLVVYCNRKREKKTIEKSAKRWLKTLGFEGITTGTPKKDDPHQTTTIVFEPLVMKSHPA